MPTASDRLPVTERTAGGFAGDLESSGIRLRCPRCSAQISELECPRCWLRMRELGGIVHALSPERMDYYARFIREYESIRAAEGRGSERDSFYLGLPYRDTTGRNARQWALRACTYDCLLTKILMPRLHRGARILDLGAGNCWMSYRLALAGFRPIAVDLLTNDLDGLDAAAHYRAYLPQFFPRVRAELIHLPFQDEQFNAVVFNASFHYVEDPEAALREALRCARPGGLVIISDTPWYSCEESGNQMVAERRARFLHLYMTASSSIDSIEFLTSARLAALEDALAIRWEIHAPSYGFRWAMRPVLAHIRHRREPARFRIFVAERLTH
jgi:SAM-dependent methyltransferase